MFLRNNNGARFGSLMLDFRKIYANNDNNYLMDVMREPTEPKKTWRLTSTAKDYNKGEQEGGASTLHRQIRTRPSGTVSAVGIKIVV